jgi:hypothetical protein
MMRSPVSVATAALLLDIISLSNALLCGLHYCCSGLRLRAIEPPSPEAAKRPFLSSCRAPRGAGAPPASSGRTRQTAHDPSRCSAARVFGLVSISLLSPFSQPPRSRVRTRRHGESRCDAIPGPANFQPPPARFPSNPHPHVPHFSSSARRGSALPRATTGTATSTTAPLLRPPTPHLPRCNT